MHHLVTEWATLPAFFTWRGGAQALALIAPRSSGWNPLFFHVNRARGGSGRADPSRSDALRATSPARGARCAPQVSPAPRPCKPHRSDQGFAQGLRGCPGTRALGAALLAQSGSQQSDSRPCGPCQSCLQNSDLQRG